MKTAPQSIEFQQTINQRFQEILPQIRACAQYAFRRQQEDLREEAVQDVVVQCFLAFNRMTRKGCTDRVFPTVLARFAILRYRSGRHASGTTRRSDLSFPKSRTADEVGQSTSRSFSTSRWAESLIEDRRTPIPEQVSFRVDFPVWLSRLSISQRRFAELLADGSKPTEVARQLKVSLSRVSQIRRRLRMDWELFQSDTKVPAIA